MSIDDAHRNSSHQARAIRRRAERLGVSTAALSAAARRNPYLLTRPVEKLIATRDALARGLELSGRDANQLWLRSPNDPADQVMACHACHAVVPHRDYVFSQPVNLQIDTMSAFGNSKETPPETLTGLTFETVSIDKLSNKLRGILPPGVNQIRMLQGDMRKHLFQGTLDESARRWPRKR